MSLVHCCHFGSSNFVQLPLSSLPYSAHASSSGAMKAMKGFGYVVNAISLGLFKVSFGVGSTRVGWEAMMLQGRCMEAARTPQNACKNAARRLQGSFLLAARTSQGCCLVILHQNHQKAFLPACLPASLPFLPACLPASLGVGLDEELVKMTKEVPPYISKLWNGLSTTGE